MQSQAQGVHPHARRRAHLLQPRGAGQVTAVARPAPAAHNAHQSRGQGYILLPIRGLHAGELRPAPPHQSRSGGVKTLAQVELFFSLPRQSEKKKTWSAMQ